MANKSRISIPSSIFANRSLSVLEAVSKYLKEEKGLAYHEIAVLLNRDDRTIWTCYNRAGKKYAECKTTVKKTVKIPSQIFKNRSLCVLEVISEYLKEKKGMTYHEIAVLLNRDDRTIWTCYNRARRKNAK